MARQRPTPFPPSHRARRRSAAAPQTTGAAPRGTRRIPQARTEHGTVYTAANKQLLQHIYAELAQGNSRPLLDAMAEDFTWTIRGRTPWSRTYRGKRAVREELLKPLFANFADRYTASIRRILADGDHVVVEFRGRVTTRAGKPYHNEYCMVYRLVGGKLHEVTEYLDTELVTAVLSPP
jgi:ketosteroid isomerase-like protein